MNMQSIFYFISFDVGNIYSVGENRYNNCVYLEKNIP